MEFRAALEEQIADTKRRKEAEKQKLEEEKRQDYDNYMRYHYKGPPPAEKESVKGPVVDRQRRGYDEEEEERPPRGRENRGMSKRRPSEDDESAVRRARDREREQQRDPSPPPMRRNGRRRHDEDDGYESTDRERETGSPRRRGKDGWVSKTEYDELSKLCERLIVQQEELSAEVRQQAEIIQVSETAVVMSLTDAGSLAIAAGKTRWWRRRSAAETRGG